jgi:hypothetical protein
MRSERKRKKKREREREGDRKTPRELQMVMSKSVQSEMTSHLRLTKDRVVNSK